MAADTAVVDSEEVDTEAEVSEAADMEVADMEVVAVGNLVVSCINYINILRNIYLFFLDCGNLKIKC